MSSDLPAPAPVDIDLNELESPGSEWAPMEGRQRAFVHKKTGHLLLVPDDDAQAPSTWSVL